MVTGSDFFVMTFASSIFNTTKLVSIEVGVPFKEKHALFMVTINVYHIVAKFFNNLLHVAIIVWYVVIRGHISFLN